MCRIAAYIGDRPLPLSALLYDPPHSLEHAAYAPRELIWGHVNVDGTGVAWWVEGRANPLRYVTDKSPWADPNLSDLAPVLSGTPLLAAVRSATPGISHGSQNVAPFVSGDLAAVHNGWIGGFRDGVGRSLLSTLSDTRFSEISSMNDSQALFQLVCQQIDDNPGIEIRDAVSRNLPTCSQDSDRGGLGGDPQSGCRFRVGDSRDQDIRRHRNQLALHAQNRRWKLGRI